MFLLLNSAIAIGSIKTISGQVTFSQAELPTSAFVKPNISDYMQVNLTGVFTQLGYTASNVTKITSDIFNRAMLTYLHTHEYIENITGPIPGSKRMVLGANSSTILPTSSQKTTNDLHSASAPFRFPLNGGESNCPNGNSTMSTNFVTNFGASPLTSGGSESKACILIAIWNYPNNNNIDFEGDYNMLNSYADDYGNYQSIVSLTNDGATNESIENALTDAVSSYDNVDVYFLGHGNTWHFYFPGGNHIDCSCYITYNGYGNDWSYNIWSCELISDAYPFYADMSALRLTFPICCYSGGRYSEAFGFQDFVLNPGGSFDHPRACISAVDGELWTDYVAHYVDKWCYYWYQNHWDSKSAAHDSETYASSFSHNGVDLTYFDHGAAFTCNPNYVSGEVESYTYSEWTPPSAAVYGKDNVIGTPDGQYVQLYAGNGPYLNYGDQAMITATMDRESAGDIYIYGQAYPDYNSHTYVYVSDDDWQTWNLVFNDHICDYVWPAPHWIYCGTYNENFRSIAIIVYDDDWWSCKIFVDTVKVIT